LSDTRANTYTQTLTYSPKEINANRDANEAVSQTKDPDLKVGDNNKPN